MINAYFPWAETEESRYYLFARTSVHPYQYYFRTYNHYKKAWGNWKRWKLPLRPPKSRP